ncbi:hypothetical protein HanIR_Chr06g0282871 [Helianthus annuus]|nr:hypothetical protein HanIR_Chr06g0282871 [Helianthus annuus]
MSLERKQRVRLEFWCVGGGLKGLTRDMVRETCVEGETVAMMLNWNVEDEEQEVNKKALILVFFPLICFTKSYIKIIIIFSTTQFLNKIYMFTDK